ncbi:TetR/AcrR family transcriptional regulator [Verrucomicrobiaceae bacterium R5-34]|nr:TetR/AcrR family transcriptional regulator [Verrucomicrobiaceae bacterium R5-34]
MASPAKERLIESAIHVFAEGGYRGGKVADIVKGADANIAAVNYHFGSKDRLFVEALRQAHAEANRVYPSKGGLPSDAPAEEKIASIARAILRRSLDQGKAGDFNRIMARTMQVPGSPVEMILKEVRGLELTYLEQVLKDLLATESKPIIEWGKSIFLQLATLVSKRPAPVSDLFPENPSPEQIEAMVEVQVGVILAALKSLPNEFPN